MNRVWLKWLFPGIAFVALASCRQESVGTAAPQLEDAGATAAPTAGSGDAAAPVSAPSDRYIVVFKRDMTARVAKGSRPISVAAAMANSMKDLPGAHVVRIFEHALDAAAVQLTPDALTTLRADPRVAYIEPDGVVTINDVQATPTWGLDRIDQHTLPLGQSYTYPTHAGEGVHAYVIDTGVYAGHSEFAVAGGGSRVVPGYDFVDNDANPDDCHGHGTHVAGTVGGKTWGVAKKVTLHSVRVLGCTGSGSVSGVIAGIDWVTANRVAPAVANMSLGGGFYQALNDAVTNSIAAGVTYSLAAGNSTADACNQSPASTPNGLTAAASTITDTAATFSNFGSCVDLFAPGENITSSWIGSPTTSLTISGTSMAAPHVAGAAALWLSLHPATTPAGVATALVGRATPNALPFVRVGTPNALLYTGELANDADVVPPSAAITNPTNGSTVTDVATIDVAASDDVGTVVVAQLFVNGVPRQSDTQEPWSFTWDAKDLPAGSYQFVVKAIDASGNIGTSAPVTVTLAHAVTPALLTVSPSSLAGGTPATGQVTLNLPAPAGGTVVSLTSSNPAVATVPASITVDEGATTATFPIATTLPPAAATVTIGASTGPVTRTAILTVAGPVRVASLVLSPTSVVGGSSAVGFVTLSEVSPTPVTVALASNSPAATTPATITIPANVLSAGFTASTPSTAADTQAVITATFPTDVSVSATLAITATPPAVVQSLTMEKASLTGGLSTTCQIALNRVAPTGGLLVTMTTSNPAAATLVVNSLTIPAGSTSALFGIVAKPVVAHTLVTITAAAPTGASATALLTVSPPLVSQVTVNPNSIIGGNPSTGTLTLTGQAPAGGFPLTVTTSNASVGLVPPTVIVPAGTTSTTFPITTFSVPAATTLVINAVDASGRKVGVALTLAPPGTPTPTSLTVDPPVITGGTNGLATVTLSQPALSPGLPVTFASDSPAVTFLPVSPVSVNPGSSTLSVLVKTTAQTSDISATITATAAGVTRSAPLTISVLPRLSSFFLNATELPAGGATTGSVAISKAASSPMTISLASDSPSVIVPATVTIPAGSQSVAFSVASTTVASLVTATVTATLADNPPKTALLRIYPSSPVPLSVSISPTALMAGQTGTATVTLNSAAPAGGAVVALSASPLDVPFARQVAVMPTTLTIPEGALLGTFTVAPTVGAGTSAISIGARLNGVFASAILTVLRNVIAGNSVRGDLQAPECNTVGAYCDTGSLIDSRSSARGGPEIGTPNTINNSCPDGMYANSPGPFPGGLFPVYRVDYSLDRLRVFTADGSALAAGKTVTIEATAWTITGGPLDLYSAPDATNPVWTFIARLVPNQGDQVVLSTTFVLPEGSRQAIRGVLFGTPLQPCTIDLAYGVSDYDDLVFATDNGGPPTNIGPRVNAGTDQTITLPPVANLAGTVSDDGLPNPPAAVASTWSKVSGPGNVTFGDATALATTATFSIAGTYVLQLTANDGALSTNDTVTIAVNTGGPANQAPVVSAGTDFTVTLPATATLVGTVSDDGSPNPPNTVTRAWSQVSGPGTATFSDATSLTPVVTFTAAGTYVLRLTASDGSLTSTDDVAVTVLPVPNRAPVANAGSDQTITLPAVANLMGSASDDGLPAPPAPFTTTWSVVNGPGTVTFANATALLTTAAFSAAGTYTLRLTANDSELSASDDVDVVVLPIPNQGPMVNAGADQAVTLPAVADLNGSASDDGLPIPPGALTTTWSLVSGPGTVTFAAPGALATTATFSVNGTYTLRLSATDGALGANDDIVVTVNPVPNTAPAVNAGPDQTITLPAVANLSGTVTDDGRPNPPRAVTSAWTKVSGPGTVTFGSASAAATTATFSAAGSYTLRLTATDGALASDDTVVVTVNPVPPNTAPTVNAGPDQTITLPAVANLSGTVTDDGRPNPPGAVTTTWSKVSGPGTVTFGNAAARSTTATFSTNGSYVLRLTASDGALSANDSVTVTVNPLPMKAQYRITEVLPKDNHIKPHLDLVNTGNATITLSQIKVRYWYTIDSQQPQTITCDFAQLGCSKITRSFVTVSPSRTGADRYVEIGFTSSAGTLAPGAKTGLIQLRWNKNDWSNYNETNDYSYTTSASTPAPTSFVDWSRVTIYQNGARIWGVEP